MPWEPGIVGSADLVGFRDPGCDLRATNLQVALRRLLPWLQADTKVEAVKNLHIPFLLGQLETSSIKNEV